MAEEYIDFTSRMKSRLGIDLQLYKQAQMKRRLTSLRNKRGFKCFPTYYQALNKDAVLLEEFVDRITINVSEFYRNPQRWDVLKNNVIPQLVTENNTITIWSAACSTGEEPYSVALILNEYFPDLSFRIIATDIDEAVLDKAKQGVYQEKALRELPSVMKRKYFKEENGFYTIDSSIKRMVTFKKHNLLSDPYPKETDLIICRNVLIYFTDEAKEIIYRNFSRSLVNKGMLFVGSTEQIFSPNKYELSAFDTFFYRKK